MANLLRRAYLTHLSKPSGDRTIYQAVLQRQPARIVEIGVGDGVRAGRILELACGFRPAGEVSYTGVDPFESEGGGKSLSLKAAFKQFRPLGIRLRLLPGDVVESLRRAANELPGTELLIVSTSDVQAFAPGWFYVPRMLAPGATVIVADPKKPDAKPRLLSALEVSQLSARRVMPQRRAA